MGRDWNNRSFSEMATSTGEEERSPFETPLAPIARADDRSQPAGQRQPFDIPVTQPQPDVPTQRRPPVDPSTGQWRATPGLAPGAQNLPPIDGRTPTTNPNGGQWRATPEVAPGARTLPPMDGGQPTYDPNNNGGIRPPGDPGVWKPSPNQVGPGAGGGDRPGGVGAGSDPMPTIGNGGLNPASDKQHANAQQSLNTQLNYFTHFAEGAIGGLAGSSIIPYFGDKLAWKTGLDGNRFAEYWRNNHSPLGLELRTRQGEIAEVTQRGAELGPQLDTAKGELRSAARDFRGTPAAGGNPAIGFQAVKELHANTVAAAAAETDAAIKAALEKKAAFLDTIIKDPIKTPEQFTRLGQRIDVNEAANVLSTSEAQLLRRQTVAYGAVVGKQNQVADLKSQISATEAEVAAAQAEMATLRAKGGNFNMAGTKKTWTDSVRPGAGKVEAELTTWNGNNKWRAAGEGIAVVGTGLAVNYAVDKFMPNMFGMVGGKDAHPADHWRSYLQGPAVAYALLRPNKNMMWRAGATALSVGVIGAAEKFFPEQPNSTYSTLMQPNYFDSVGMGAAWMMPFANWKSRALAVGGMYALGRVANVAASMGVPLGIGDHHYAVGMNDDAAQAIASQKVSGSSFNDIVKTSSKLAMENEGAFTVQMSDFMNNKAHDPLYHLHGAAGLYTAIGDVYMARGTKIDPAALNDKGRILSGQNYDLGGQATGFYRQALANLVEGQNQALRNNQNDQANGMKDAQKDVMERLDRIYGQHNISTIFDKLQEEYRQNISTLPAYQIKLKQQVDALQTRDSAYAAKMTRDLALLDLAIANYAADKNEGGKAQIMYAEALKYLQASERIDGKAPDVAQIRKIADGMKSKVPQAVNNQFNNGFNNPMGVR